MASSRTVAEAPTALTPASPSANWWQNPLARSRVARPTDLSSQIAEYYLETWKDYRGAWMNSRNRAMHFGFWDPSVTSHDDALRRSNEVLVGSADLHRESRCLDLGAGVGGTAMWIAETYKAHVTGLTLIRDQAERIARYAAERQLTELVEPRVGDFHHLPFEDETFDLVYSQEAIVHAERPVDVLAEAARALKPGGRLALAEYVATAQPHSERFQVAKDSWRMPDIISNATLRHELEKHFVDVELLTATSNVFPSVRRLRRLSILTLRAQRALRRVGLRTDAQIENVEGALALHDSLVYGDWFYAYVYARKAE